MILQVMAIGFLLSTSQICPPPVITLNGYDTVTVRCNRTYVELGATAWSACDGDLSSRVIVDNSRVNTGRPGSYPVYYDVTDNRGIPAQQVTRMVVVEDNFSLTLDGFVFVTDVEDYGRMHVTAWECNRPYDDPGAIAWDDCDGDLSSQIVVLGAEDVLPGQLDTYHLVSYQVQNRRGDILTAQRLVWIVDRLEPAVSLLGKGESPAEILDNQQPDPEWWVSCLSAYDSKYPEGDPWRLFDLYPRWRIKDDWTADDYPPFMWYCDRPHFEDPGALSFDECEGPIHPDKILFVLIYYDTTANKWLFRFVGFMGDFVNNPPPPLANGVRYRAFYISVDSSGNGPWGMGAQLFYWRSIRSRQISPRYAVGITGVSGDVEIECNTPFDPAANVRAMSTCEGDITSRMIIHAGDFDNSRPGSYRIRYEAVDNYGWLGWAQRNINVVDNGRPIITLLNDQGTPSALPVTVIPWCALRDNGDIWWDEEWFALRPNRGWTVMDACDDNTVLTNKVTVGGAAELRKSLGFLAAIRNQSTQYPVDPAPYLRIHSLNHNVMDNAQNPAQPAYRFVDVVPTYPEIRLIGDEEISIECGQPFVAPLVEVRDVPAIEGVVGCSTEIDPDFLTITGVVDPATPDNYIISYYAINALGYDDFAQRIVRVQDTLPPVVTISPRPGHVITPALEWESGQPFTPAQVIHVQGNDACDGEVSAYLKERGGMDFSSPTPGVYRIVYAAVDSAGNEGTATLRVLVESDDEDEGEGEDDRLPTIELRGAAEITVECGDSFTDPGATAEDEVDGNLTSSIVTTGRVDTWKAGSYTLTYTVKNSVNNTASVSRTVIIADSLAPIITLRGQPSMNVNLNDRFIDPGATAHDVCDGTVEVAISGEVNTGRVGIYTLLYTAADSAGNAADPLTRNVSVTDPKQLDDEEGEGEGEGAREGEGEGEGEPPTDCLGCTGCGGDKSLLDRFNRVVGDYLVIGIALITLLAWNVSRKRF